jgi:hypothetical protein
LRFWMLWKFKAARWSSMRDFRSISKIETPSRFLCFTSLSLFREVSWKIEHRKLRQLKKTDSVREQHRNFVARWMTRIFWTFRVHESDQNLRCQPQSHEMAW